MKITKDQISGDYKNLKNTNFSGTVENDRSITVTIADEASDKKPYFKAFITDVSFSIFDSDYNTVENQQAVKTINEQISGTTYFFDNNTNYAFSEKISVGNVRFSQRSLSYTFSGDNTRLTIGGFTISYVDGEGGATIGNASFKYKILVGDIVLDGNVSLNGDLCINNNGGNTNLIIDSGTTNLIQNSGKVNVSGNSSIKINGAQDILIPLNTSSPLTGSITFNVTGGKITTITITQLSKEKSYFCKIGDYCDCIVRYREPMYCLANGSGHLYYVENEPENYESISEIPFIVDAFIVNDNTLGIYYATGQKYYTSTTVNLYEIVKVNYQ